MFKGLQGIINKAGKYQPKPVTSEIMPLKTGEHLINTPKRAKLINETLPLLCLSPEDTAGYCNALVHRFAEFVQTLPETRHSFYAHPGGFLDHAIERSHVALKLCRAYFLPAGDETSTLTVPQTRWAYALYSASMLHDVGRLIVDLTVKVMNDEHDEGRPWFPFDGSMLTQGALYQYNFNSDYPEEFRRSVSLLLAKTIMPEAGLRWIMDNRDVFLVWIALITDDAVNSGTLGAVLDRADAQAIANHVREQGQRFDHLDNTVVTSDPSYVDSLGHTPTEAAAGDQTTDARRVAESGSGMAFINWLRSELAANKLMINTAPLFGVPGGFLMGNDILKLFIQNNPQHNSIENVRNSLRTLGLLSGEQSFMHIGENKKLSGTVLTHPQLILQGLSGAIAQQYQTGLSQFARSTASSQATQYFGTAGDRLNEAQVREQGNTQILTVNPFHR